MAQSTLSPQEFGPLWDRIMAEVKKVLERYDVPVNLAIVGFGKSGKSTLFNAIFGKDVQETGAQTDLTKEDTEARVFGTILTDTRGFGTPLVSLEDIKPALHDQNLIIHCINGMTAISKDDKDLYDFCRECGKHVLVAVTKSDVMKEREIGEYRESLLQKIDAFLEPIFISAETGLNMTVLMQTIVHILPEAARDAFIAKQRVDLEMKRKKSHMVIHGTAVAAAGVAVSPIPVSDVIVLIPMQAGMVVSIGAIYGYEITPKRAKEILAVAAGGIVLRYAFQVLVKFLPGFGSLIGPAIAYAGTVAIGEAALAYFESGMKATPEEIENAYRRAKENAEKDFEGRKLQDRIREHEDEIKRLKEKLSKGEISQEEFEKAVENLLE